MKIDRTQVDVSKELDKLINDFNSDCESVNYFIDYLTDKIARGYKKEIHKDVLEALKELIIENVSEYMALRNLCFIYNHKFESRIVNVSKKDYRNHMIFVLKEFCRFMYKEDYEIILYHANKQIEKNTEKRVIDLLSRFG